ncbi:MAG: cholesterol oxidase [Colwellia sp.]|jgi:cholesterol oxidase
MSDKQFDFDQIIIGSGFGGSVSALRLTEKGNKVLILEKGKYRNDEDYPESSKNAGDYVWAPKLGLRGTTQISYTSKATIIHGVGVGGGSQIYANVHFIPDEKIFNNPSWKISNDNWYQELKPFYGLAQRMLGTAKNTFTNIADDTLKEVAKELGTEDSFTTVDTGVYLPQEDGEQGKVSSDPYFNGDGPDRETCRYCARCSIGCRYNAKNTLMKNYLFFAQRNGAEIRADSEVVLIEPIGAADGSEGYQVTVKESKGKNIRTYTLKSKGVVVSGGVMGTVPMLLKMRDQYKTLPNISSWLGQQVRTNSETLTTANNMKAEVNPGLFISSFISIDSDTNMEINRFGNDGDATWRYFPFVPMVTGEGFSRFLKFVANTLLHPLKTWKVFNPKGKAKSSILFLVMQSSEAFIHFEWRRRWYRLFTKGITAVQKEGDTKLKVSFPDAEKATRMYAEKLGGEPGSALSEIVLGTPVTAHIMGGVAIGKDANTGVIDESGEIFGYKNLRVLDGSVISGNLGVNPSLTITALSEYMMSKIPVADKEKAAKITPISFSLPLPGQVSSLTGSGDLIKVICK